MYCSGKINMYDKNTRNKMILVNRKKEYENYAMQISVCKKLIIFIWSLAWL